MSVMRYVAAILFTLFTLQVQAGDVVTGSSGWVTLEHADGLTVQIPAPATDGLLNQVRQLRARLLDRQVELTRTLHEAGQL